MEEGEVGALSTEVNMGRLGRAWLSQEVLFIMVECGKVP